MKELIIIGGGQSGVASAIEAQEKNIDYLLIDKHNSLGGSWLDYPEKTKLFSPWFASLISKQNNIKKDLNAYPLRDEVSAYIQKIGVQRQINFKGGIHILENGISYNNNQKYFTIQTNIENLYAKNIILAMGPFSHIKNITLPFEKNFKGIVTHAHYYGKPENYPTVKKVVVIGSRNSAVQIAYDFLKNGKQVILSSRSKKIFWIKKKIFGKSVHYFLHTLKIDYILNFLMNIFNIPDKSVFDDGVYEDVFNNKEIIKKDLPKETNGRDIIWSDGSITKNVDLIVKAIGYESINVTLKRYIKRDTYEFYLKRTIPLFLCGMTKSRRSSIRWAKRNAKKSVSRVLKNI